MNDTNAEKRDWNALSVSFLLVAVVVFSGIFMYKMTNILDAHSPLRERKGTSVISAACTNEVRVFDSPSSCVNRSQYEDTAIIAAYDALQNELSTWMAIMGIFAAIFGLVIPLGGYLLQRQSLKDERVSLMEDVEKSRDEVLDSIKKIAEGVPDKIANDMRPMWNFLAANFDRFLVKDGECLLSAVPPDWRAIANYVVELDICLDCLVRARNPGRLVEIICKYREYIESSQKRYPVIWATAIRQLKEKMHPSNEFTSGRDFEPLVGRDSGIYAWLKNFYGQFAPWKFA